MKKQLLTIHGSDIFETYKDYFSYLEKYEMSESKLRPQKRWKSSLQDTLGDGYDVLQPEMPLSGWNSRYAEWEIWFEKMIPFLDDEVMLLGHSQGGIFLAKYLSEKTLPKKIRALFLVAPSITGTPNEPALDFELRNNEDFSNLVKQVDYISIYHSKDDFVVPFSHFEQFVQKIPQAHGHIFEDRGHFLQEEFPEIVQEIKDLE